MTTETEQHTLTQEELWQRTFDNLPADMREQGCTEEQITKAVADMQHGKRVADKLETMGLVVRSRKHLLRMSNVSWRGERLHDGVCHYQWQTAISGNTFPYRDRLRAAGFQWYPLGNVWAKPMENGTIIENLEDAREMLATW